MTVIIIHLTLSIIHEFALGVLYYYNYGTRHYAAVPIFPGRARPFWEFQAVVRGRIGRTVTKEQDPPEFHAASLWISRPGSDHGWMGENGRAAEVVVFHFRHVSMALESCLGSSMSLRIDLSREQCARVLELSNSIRQYWDQPSPGMLLCADTVLSTLSLLVFEKSRGSLSKADARDDQRVSAALKYYTEKLPENPTLESVAASVGVSAVHLRRLFQTKFGQSPKSVFEELRNRRILQLLSDGRLSLAQIAEQVGFSEPSAFTRAFKSRFGCPPSSWRQ
jgi:AraC-like DNA-binding protein